MANRAHGANMTPQEDEALCRSYIIVSTNAIVRSSQTIDRFWDAITIEYHKQPGIVNERPLGSLQSRYHYISKAVMLYVAKLSHAMQHQASGTNEMDVINMAREAYLSDKGKQFTFDRYYQILKHYKKYDLSTTSQNTQHSRFGLEYGGSSSINLCDDSSPIDIELPSDRPIGRKAEKLAKKKKNHADALVTAQASLEKAEKMDSKNLFYTKEAHESRIRVDDHISQLVGLRKRDNERAAREEEMKIRMEERQQRLEDDSVMSMDTTHMNEQQLRYHNWRMNGIAMRRQQQSQNSQNFSLDHY